jgi:hypothetical protein
MRAVFVAMTLVLAMAGSAAPAWAGSAEDPEFTDTCGVVGLTEDPTSPTTPWTDVCTGWFTTTDDGLAVTVTFAGDLESRTESYYQAAWSVGDCRYRLSTADPVGDGRYEVGPVVVAAPGMTTLRVTCGESTPRECAPTEPLVFECSDPAPTTHYPLDDDTVTVQGNRLTWTLSPDGALSEIADDLAPGTVLERPALFTRAGLGVALGGSYCIGSTCGEVAGDYVRGRDYTVGS